MPSPKESLTLKGPSRRIEWGILAFMLCVFIVPLIIINSGMLGIKHPISNPRNPINNLKSTSLTLMRLPEIHPSLEEAFNGRRFGLWNEYISECRLIRNGTIKSPASECSLGNEQLFEQFLDVSRRLYGQTHESITVESWRAHCQLQLILKDVRGPMACQVAAFMAVPFHFRAENRKKIEDETRQKVSKQQGYDKKAVKLVVVTVYSPYQQKQKLTKSTSLTIKSACYHNISLTILGAGNSEVGGSLGLKVTLLSNFMRSIKDPNNTVVLFVDGQDVLFQADSSTILQRFLALNKRILFSAEHACYPMKYFPLNLNIDDWLGPCSGSCSNGRYVCDSLYPQPSSKLKDKGNKWLNSGGFIGFANDMKELLDSVSRIPADLLQYWPGADQGLYTHLLLSGQWNIDLDFESKLFLSYGLTDDPHEVYAKRVTTKELLKEIVQYDANGNRTLTTWRNSVDNTVPNIVHFNADGKSVLETVIKNYMTVNYYKCKKSITVL